MIVYYDGKYRSTVWKSTRRLDSRDFKRLVLCDFSLKAQTFKDWAWVLA